MKVDSQRLTGFRGSYLASSVIDIAFSCNGTDLQGLDKTCEVGSGSFSTCLENSPIFFTILAPTIYHLLQYTLFIGEVSALGDLSVTRALSSNSS